MLISSSGNAAITRIRALRRRKDRDATGLFFLEGIRAVIEAVDTGASIDAIVVAPDLLRSEFAREVVERARQRGETILEVSAAVFRALSLKDGPQGLGAVVHQRCDELTNLSVDGDDLWVALDAVADPGNLGAVLRTADAVAARGVILLGNTADPYDPEALRANMGAIFNLSLARASWEEFLTWRNGSMLVGATGSVTTSYRDVQYRRPLVMLMGSERHGLSAEQQAACDELTRIPMAGRADSLNLAVATGVMLYEIVGQTGPVQTGSTASETTP